MATEKLRSEGQGQAAVGPRHARVGDLVLRLIEQALARDWSAIIGRIEAIDQTTLRAKVRPLVRLPIEKDNTVPLGILYEVPVDVERASPFYTRHPYRVKDIVLLVVNDRSLEYTIQDHEPQDPKIDHVSSLEDVIVLGGFRADTDNTYPAAWQRDLLTQNDETKDTEVWYEKGGVQRILPGQHAGYSYRMDAQYKVLIQSLWERVILHAAEKIMLGMKDEYRALLAEPVIDTYNEHTHQCPCGITTPPLQPMSLSVHASGLVWLQKDPGGRQAMQNVESTSDPACSGCGCCGSCGGVGCLTCGQDVVDYLLDLMGDGGIDLGKVGDAIGDAIQAITDTIGGALTELGKFLEDCCREAVQEIAKFVGQAVDYVVGVALDVLTDMILSDPLGFAVRLVSDPIGLATEFLARAGNEMAADLTGVDLMQAGTDLLNAAGEWLADKAIEAAGAVAESLGLEGAAEFAQLVNDAVANAEAGDWEGVARNVITAAGGDPSNDMLVAAVAWAVSGIVKYASDLANGQQEEAAPVPA